MTLITRVTRLFKADFHRVLDHIEEPEALLMHAIREMQESLDSAVLNLDSSLQRDQEQTSQISDLEQSIDELNGQLDLCFESNKEDLARSLVRRKLEANALKKQIAAQQQSLKQSIAQQQETLAENQLSLEHLRQKADVLTVRRNNTEDAQGSIDSILTRAGGVSVDDTDVDVAFLREKQSRGAS